MPEPSSTPGSEPTARLVGIRGVVVDIEGTTSATSSVHVGLYDFARPRLGPWVRDHADDPAVVGAVAATRSDAGLGDDASTDAIVQVWLDWMDRDVKAAPLKTVQGQIWAAGFAAGQLASHMFDDVPPAMRAWHAQGFGLAVYSSGSVDSQRPWFRHSDHGDLTTLISAYFDTVNAGPKRQADSYRRIADDLTTRWDCRVEQLVFLSDVPAELDAARDAGWATIGLRRPGEPQADSDFGTHPVVTSFAQIQLPNPDDGVPHVTSTSAQSVLDAGRRLAVEAARFTGMGWMRGTSGNLSEVVDREPLRLVVTSSGVDKGELVETDVVLVDDRGAAVDVPGLVSKVPSAEAGLHARIVQATGAGAVVHVHVLSAVVAAHRWPLGIELRDLEMLKGIGRSAHDDVVTVPVIENSQDMDELGDRFVAAHVVDVPAVIVARHGMYVWGDTLRQARHHAECLEWLLSFALATTTGDMP